VTGSGRLAEHGRQGRLEELFPKQRRGNKDGRRF